MTTDYSSFPSVEKAASFGVPSKQINSEVDVVRFMRSVACERIVGFVLLLNDAVKGKTCVDEDIHSSETIVDLCRLLDELNSWIEDIPPSSGPRRFGNVAFRDWIRRLEEVREFYQSKANLAGTGSAECPPATGMPSCFSRNCALFHRRLWVWTTAGLWNRT
jgi:hypothetical protein